MATATTWMTAYRVPDTLMSDTEESVLGTEWHQDAISALADMLREVARRRGAAWGVCVTIALMGLRHEDGSDYDPRPDIMVLARPLPSGGMASIPIAEAGAPLFIAEVASESTVRNDVGDKRAAYAAIGVPEYLVFDPGGGGLPVPARGWRLREGVYAPWRAEADGSWRSGVLDVAFEPTRPYMNIRDRDGRAIGLPEVVRARAEYLEGQVAEMERAHAEATRRAAELEEEVRRLREGRDR